MHRRRPGHRGGFRAHLSRLAASEIGLPLAVVDASTIRLVVESGTTAERRRPLRADEMRQECKRLQSLGVRVAGPPEPQDWGGILLTIEDPAGNELQIAQYPAAN